MGKKVGEIVRLIFESVLKIIYPENIGCIVCGDSESDGLCSKCFHKIALCKEDELCIGYYGGVLKELILKFKYYKDFEAGEILIDLVENKLDLIDKDFYITYIPISKKSFAERGFNQCEYIASELAFRNGMKSIDTIKRVKEIKEQKTLTKDERKINVKGSFDVIDKNKVADRKFLLVDDVITTGATLSEAVRVLEKNGAKEIKILTLAKSHI